MNHDRNMNRELKMSFLTTPRQKKYLCVDTVKYRELTITSLNSAVVYLAKTSVRKKISFFLSLGFLMYNINLKLKFVIILLRISQA